MPQYHFHRASVKRNDSVVVILGDLVEASLLALLAMLQEFGAHHRRQSQRNSRRNQDRHGQRDRKLAKQPSYNVAHEQQRDQHCNQRNRQRNNREADLSRAFQSGVERGVPCLQVAINVFDHDNGVIHHKAG